MPVPDPYRWLEDPNDPATKDWLVGQARLLETELDILPGREGFKTRITELLRSGSVGAPTWRGERRFFMRRTPEQEHAVLYTVDSGGTERALLDPMALDSTGLTTLDSWQPDKEGRLLAYQVSVGGDEESSLYLMDIAFGDRIEGPIDRCRYSPVAWLPGGEAFYYVRRLPATEVPEGRSSSTAGSTCTGSAPPPRRMS